MGQIEIVNAAFHRASQDVDAGVTTLRTQRERIDAEVVSLLAGGWSGIAADSFADAWQDWLEAADEITRGLEAMGLLLDAAHRDFLSTDDRTEQQMNDLAARLVDRLGGVG